MREDVIFQRAGMLVTTRRVSCAGESFPLHNLTSVRADHSRNKPMRILVFLVLGGLAAIAIGTFLALQQDSVVDAFVWFLSSLTFCSVPILPTAFVMWRRCESEVILHTAGAQQRTFTHRDAQVITKAAGAISYAASHAAK